MTHSTSRGLLYTAPPTEDERTEPTADRTRRRESTVENTAVADD